MIELPPDLMAALQAEAERQGKTASEIAAKAIKEWIDPEPWFDINEPMEPPRRVELPIEGATYLTSEGGYPVRVKAVKPLWEPPQPVHVITIEFQSESEEGEWEELRIFGEDWMDLAEECGLTLESVSKPGITRVPDECMAAENSPDKHG